MIHALKTGSALIKSAMKMGRGATAQERRQAMLDDPDWIGPIPIHVWLIEHPEGLVLVDTGQLSGQADGQIVRWLVGREDEIDVQLELAGFSIGDLRLIVLTHLHSDHMNGAPHFPRTPIIVCDAELDHSRKAQQSAAILRHPTLSAFKLIDESFGAFDRNLAVTQDANIRVVPTPGHTQGHASVIVIENNMHYMLAGDLSYSQEMLQKGRVDGVSFDGDVARQTFRTTLAHARMHPTVFLPSHDPESEERLHRNVLLH